MAWKALKALVVFLLVVYVSGKDANIAYHIIWNEGSSLSLSDYLATIYDANNLYLVDVASSPPLAPLRDDLVTSVARHPNVRMRSVRRAVPHGVSEVLQLLDGMGELVWWSEEPDVSGIDFYIPLYSSDLVPVLSPGAMRSVLSVFRGYSFFNSAPGDSVYDVTYFDANLVFSRNASALSKLQGPHTMDPEHRHRAQYKSALVNTRRGKSFVASGELMRHAVDSRLSTRLLASMANSFDARDYFFATLAHASYTPMITTSSLRCEQEVDASCLFEKRSNGNARNKNTHETVITAVKAHIPRSMVQIDPTSSRVLPL